MHTKFQVKRAYNEEMKNQKLICFWATFLWQQNSESYGWKWVNKGKLDKQTYTPR